MNKASIVFFLIAILGLLACNNSSSDTQQRGANEAARYDSLRLVLETVYDTDQGIRAKLLTAKEKELGRVAHQMRGIDATNQESVNRILSDFGWLKQSQVGEKASDALFLVVQHAGIDVIKEYFPSLKSLAEQGEAKSTHAAMMEDRLLMYEGKEQIYGTQASSDTSGSFYIWPVKYPDKVNTLRKEVGFEQTIEENAQRLDAIYDPKRKLSKNK